jgi:hypothetical protein
MPFCGAKLLFQVGVFNRRALFPEGRGLFLVGITQYLLKRKPQERRLRVFLFHDGRRFIIEVDQLQCRRGSADCAHINSNTKIVDAKARAPFSDQ